MTWAVPNWYALVLLALAAYRIWRLLAHDTILDPLRRRIVGDKRQRDQGWPPSSTEEFLQCPFCLGFWVALAWWLAWVAWPHGTLVAAVPFALSAFLALIATHDGTD